MNENKNRHTVWLTDETWNVVKEHYRKDNCSAQNEYIEKAIQFYSGYHRLHSIEITIIHNYSVRIIRRGGRLLWL